MNNKNLSNFNKGYSKYTKESVVSKLTLEDSNENNINKENKKINKYPKGYLYVFFISIITITIFLLCFLIKRPVDVEPNGDDIKIVYGNMSWSNSLSIAFGVGFFLNIMWLISRQLLSLRSKFTGKKMWDYFTFKPIRERRNFVIRSWAINDVKNFSEYEQYCLIKKKTTAKVFYISISIYTILFIVSIILSVTVK